MVDSVPRTEQDAPILPAVLDTIILVLCTWTLYPQHKRVPVCVPFDLLQPHTGTSSVIMRRRGSEQSSSPQCRKPRMAIVKRPSSGESTGLCDGRWLRSQTMALPRPHCNVLGSMATSKALNTITACSASHGSTCERCTRTCFSGSRTGSCFGSECEEPCQDIPAKAKKTRAHINNPDRPASRLPQGGSR